MFKLFTGFSEVRFCVQNFRQKNNKLLELFFIQIVRKSLKKKDFFLLFYTDKTLYFFHIKDSGSSHVIKYLNLEFELALVCIQMSEWWKSLP